MEESERHWTEQLLRDSEERFRTSVETMLDCFGIFSARRDASGRIVDFTIDYLNAAACLNNRRTLDEQRGRGLLELMPNHREVGLFDEYCRVVETGAPLSKDLLFYADDYAGERLGRWFEIRAARMGDGFVSAWRDVTERKRTEEALREADRRKDEFLSMLAHELRNPLGPIRNALTVLQIAGPKVSPLVEAREMIDRQVTHMARLVDDLLDVSRVARGKIQLRKELCDLAVIARQTAEDYRGTLEASGLAVEVRLPGEPVWVQGDPTRLAQVISNVLHNANKFSDPGGRVVVSVEQEGGSGGSGGSGRWAVVRVRDTGIGMDAQTLARIFEPFSQADTSLDRSRGGLGLGLSLVKGIVELHGGEARAASEGLGRGTEIVLQLPADSPPAGRGAASRALGPVPASRRVLVIEDNEDAAESMRMLLELLGHQVEVAHSGQAGLELARGLRPEIVLCDIGLPGGMDGYEVARAFRREPALAAAYLVALTGYGQQEDQQRAREAGFDLHAVKPVEIAILERVLATA